jgi:hypothetical protein
MAKAKRINLALQGGGAHGAFTWGVLDRLLESDEIEIAGISGTSAGALNGAALKAGWPGRPGRRARTSPGSGSRWARSPTRASPMARGGGPSRRQPRDRGLPALRRRRQRRAHGQPLRRRAVLPAIRCRRIVERFHYDEVCGDPGPPSTSAPPMCGPARSASSPATRSGPRRSWPRPACRRCSRRWRSPTPRPDGWRPTGTAAIPATPRSSRCSRRGCPAISWW